MRCNRVLLIYVAVAFATVMAASTPVHAGKRMLVLIDASGSMNTPRDNTDCKGTTRFEAAKTLATSRLNDQLGIDSSILVAVYTFHDITTLVPHTGGAFITGNAALDAIECLAPPPPPTPGCPIPPPPPACVTPPAVVSGSTPLAGAMCGAVDILETFPTDTRILQVSSDGEENSTLSGPCHGDLDAVPPFPASSWQGKVLDYFTGKPVITQVDLFNSAPILLAPGQESPDPEGILTLQARSLATTASTLTGLTPLEEFFRLLTEATGGQLNIIRDDKPLPVPGDLNGDRCVDHTDAILVARAFGPIVPPIDGRFDLNLDRTVDFTDYLLQLSRITSTCGPDPYVRRAPLVCKGGSPIVINGQAIEDGGLTIDARGSCAITIKNSLIVSGQNAITVVGKTRITIDNSIIVGQNAVIVQHGGGVLSAGNTIFHGQTSFEGSLQFIDRGGNVFE